MIGKLTGTVDQIYKNFLILDVNGVGYRVAVPIPMLTRNLKRGESLTLYTHTYVRDDVLALFGFDSLDQLSLFETLLSIAGVGPRIALNIISSGNLDVISEATLNGDVDFFSNIQGIGKKTAQRIIVDLRAILGSGKETTLLEISIPAYEETVQALRQFGFSASEARETLRGIKGKEKMTTEELLKEAFKQIGK